MKKNKKPKHYQSEVKNPSKAENAVNPGNTHYQSGMGKLSKTAKAVNGEIWNYYIALAVILLISLYAYSLILKNGFVWDDRLYIIDNNLIKNLSWKGIGAIFNNFSLDIYCPLTFLIHAVVFKIGALNPVMFHFTSLIFHLLNTALVFWFIKMLCDRWEVAAIVALLFGIHPMGVESVAWASAGTNIHCAAFFLGSLIAYLYYLQQRQKRYLFISLLFFILSLLSKTVSVLLPFVLLLTDYYKGRKITIKILMEKVPFLIIAVATGILTVELKYHSFGVSLVDLNLVFPFPQRIIFACYGFITYLVKLILPLHLSPFYPYPEGKIPYHYYAYPVLIIGLAAYVVYSVRSARMNRSDRFSKKIIFGIGFFAFTVFLLLQIVPAGRVIMADRYTYIPSIGIFYLAGEGLSSMINGQCSMFNKIKWSRIFGIALLSVAGVFYFVKTYSGCSVWKNDEIFWSDVINKYPGIEEPYYNRGIVYMKEKRHDEAIKDFNKAIELRPDFMDAYINRGLVYVNEKRYDEALKNLNKAIEINPGNSASYLNRGNIYFNEKRNSEAIRDFNKAIELNPGYALAYYNKGIFEYQSGNKDAACTDLMKAADLGYKPAAEALSRLCK